MELGPHSERILRRILLLMDQYREKKIGLRRLVDALEGSINALEEKPAEEFQQRWYRHWGGLEQILASGNEDLRREEISHELREIERLISETLSS